MSQLSPVLRQAEDSTLLFWCPGCETAHGIQTGKGKGPRWTWDGNKERPTFAPSILVRWHRLTAKGRAAYKEWMQAGCPGAAPTSLESVPHVCHSFVRGGRIEFLNDCT